MSCMLAHVILVRDTYFRADSRFPPSQWEAALLCNDDSYWLGTSLESALYSLRIAKKMMLVYVWDSAATRRNNVYAPIRLKGLMYVLTHNVKMKCCGNILQHINTLIAQAIQELSVDIQLLKIDTSTIDTDSYYISCHTAIMLRMICCKYLYAYNTYIASSWRTCVSKDPS